MALNIRTVRAMRSRRARSQSEEIPFASGFSVNPESEQGPFFRINVFICKWEGSHECIEDREINFTLHNSGSVDCHPDLLLVMPFFGVFSGNIEPIG